MKEKILIIRFSSFGDIVQCMGSLKTLKNIYPEGEIHWVTKSEFTPLLKLHPDVKKVWSLDKGKGIKGLLEICKMLEKENYTLFYDAHSNLRSRLLKFFLFSPLKSLLVKRKTSWITRKKFRLKRFLLFKLRLNLFDNPFKGALSYQAPLLKLKKVPLYLQQNSWNFDKAVVDKVSSLIFDKSNKVISLAPSAAWKMKRWPIAYWKKVIELCPNKKFIILGGPKDYFCQELEDLFPLRVKNLAGKLNLVESCFAIQSSEALISGDTGLLHVADHLGKNAIALIGPTAFGYPSGSWVKVLEANLSCRPCSKDGRGKCRNKVYQNCMVQITPETVSHYIN